MSLWLKTPEERYQAAAIAQQLRKDPCDADDQTNGKMMFPIGAGTWQLEGGPLLSWGLALEFGELPAQQYLPSLTRGEKVITLVLRVPKEARGWTPKEKKITFFPSAVFQAPSSTSYLQGT